MCWWWYGLKQQPLVKPLNSDCEVRGAGPLHLLSQNRCEHWQKVLCSEVPLGGRDMPRLSWKVPMIHQEIYPKYFISSYVWINGRPKSLTMEVFKEDFGDDFWEDFWNENIFIVAIVWQKCCVKKQQIKQMLSINHGMQLCVTIHCRTTPINKFYCHRRQLCGYLIIN